MSRVTSQAEQALLRAVDRVVDTVTAGESPTAAVVKVAREYRLTPGAVQLVVNAYNIGATNTQRESGRDLLEKTADVAIADISQVRQLLWPDTAEVKAAYRQEQQQGVDSDYAFSPRYFLQQRKYATYQPEPEAPVANRPLTFRSESQLAYLRQDRLDKAAEAARLEASAVLDKMAELIAEIGREVRTPYPVPYVDFRKNAEALYGDAALAVLPHIERAAGGGLKQAAHVVEQFSPAVGRPYDLLQELLTTAKSYAKKAEAREATQLAAAQNREKWAAVTTKPEPPGFSLLDDTKTAAAATIAPLAWAAGNMANLYNQLNVAKERQREKAETVFSNELTDPRHEQQLETLRTQAMLHSFMLDDDVIGGYDPREVMDAYNDLRQAAPGVASNAGLIRPLLRKRLEQGALADFDAAQLVDIGRKLQASGTPQAKLSL